MCIRDRPYTASILFCIEFIFLLNLSYHYFIDLGINKVNSVPTNSFEVNLTLISKVLEIDFKRLNPIPLPLIFLTLTSALLKNLSKIRF